MKLVDYMVKTYLLVSVFAFCIVSNAGLNENKPILTGEEKVLGFLHQFRSSIDTIGGKIVVRYDSLSLIEERSQKRFKLLHNDVLIFEGDREKYSYQMEVFNYSHLVISCVEGINTAAGPDLFTRDIVYIYDLNAPILQTANLKNIYLTRSKKFLLESYHYQTEEFLNKGYPRYCAIDTIDLKNEKVVLVNQNIKKQEFKTSFVNIPFAH